MDKIDNLNRKLQKKMNNNDNTFIISIDFGTHVNLSIGEKSYQGISHEKRDELLKGIEVKREIFLHWESLTVLSFFCLLDYVLTM